MIHDLSGFPGNLSGNTNVKIFWLSYQKLSPNARKWMQKNLFSSSARHSLGTKVPWTLEWPYTEGIWLYCDYFIWCVSCTMVVLTGFVMCECVDFVKCGFCNVWVCVCVGFVMCVCFENYLSVLVICVLVFTAFLYCFFYVYIFYVYFLLV